MKILERGCRVYSPGDGRVDTNGTRTERTVVCRASGAKQITQSVTDYAPGESPAFVNPVAEEVLYVASGEGVCRVDGFVYSLRPGAAVYVPPGVACQVEAGGADTLRIVSSCCPEDPGRAATDPPPHPDRERPRLRVHEDDREYIRAGQDRIFRYLVHTDVGCRAVTQFVGWIPASKAPFHYHSYEECIYILEGHGILHLDTHPSAAEFGPGYSIYLPDGVVHCLENPGPAPIRLLGVFYPSGSPSAAYESH
ncbi:MAG TPA: cupin domain-containing protein [Bryobacteraceae bacterium]|nr:cupin domain-containing protein [Bryobacteraceae bacterium]